MLSALLGAAGTVASGIFGSNAADKQVKLQKQFAKNAIQWKVADAKAAGIHPLYGLGANTVSYSPVSVGSPDLGAMGADIGRAIDATSSDTGRVANGILGKLALERAGLENELLRANIRSVNNRAASQVGPPMPGLIPEVTRVPVRTDGVNIGVGVPSNPYFSDAQSFEDRYGEFGGSLLGLGNIPADIGHSAWHGFWRNYGKRNYSRPNPVRR